MPTIAFANRKGGVGKTTTVANLAVALAQLNKRVLAIDLDAQANLTESFGIGRDEVELGVGEILEDPKLGIDRAIYALPEPFGFDVAPSSDYLARAETALQSRATGAHVLRQLLKGTRKYDFILIDTPPGIGTMVGAALVAADELVIPSTPEVLSFNAVLKLKVLVEELHDAGVNESLAMRGVLLTMAQDRLLLTREVSQALKREGLAELPIRIPRSIRVAEAPGFGVPIVLQQPTNPIAIAYKQLAKCFLRPTRRRKAA